MLLNKNGFNDRDVDFCTNLRNLQKVRAPNFKFQQEFLPVMEDENEDVESDSEEDSKIIEIDQE